MPFSAHRLGVSLPFQAHCPMLARQAFPITRRTIFMQTIQSHAFTRNVRLLAYDCFHCGTGLALVNFGARQGKSELHLYRRFLSYADQCDPCAPQVWLKVPITIVDKNRYEPTH
jgi:hypothetical protein